MRFKLLLGMICAIISCGPGTAEVKDETPSCPTVRQTEQGVCIYACNGAVACPSALELIGTNPRIRIRMVDAPPKKEE